MRLFNRVNFLKLPAGVLYCQGQRWAFDGLCVKGDTVVGVDFLERSLDGIDFDSSEQLFERYEEMERDGVSYPIDDSYCRDGLFDDDAVFLVLESSDLDVLVSIIDGARSVTTQI